MTLLPATPSDTNDSDSSESRDPQDRAQAPRNLTYDEILRLLSQLDSLVMMGMIELPKAKFIQQTLKIQLTALMQKPQAESHRAVPMEDLAAALRRDPSLGKLFAGFLSAEQIEWLLQQGRAAPKG